MNKEVKLDFKSIKNALTSIGVNIKNFIKSKFLKNVAFIPNL